MMSAEQGWFEGLEAGGGPTLRALHGASNVAKVAPSCGRAARGPDGEQEERWRAEAGGVNPTHFGEGARVKQTVPLPSSAHTLRFFKHHNHSRAAAHVQSESQRQGQSYPKPAPAPEPGPLVVPGPGPALPLPLPLSPCRRSQIAPPRATSRNRCKLTSIRITLATSNPRARTRPD